MKKSLIHFILNSRALSPMPSATRIWPINTSYAYSDNLTTLITNGGQVDRIKEVNDSSVNNNLVWIGGEVETSLVEQISDTEYGSGKPRFWDYHGGMLQINNTFNRKYETPSLTPAISGACTFINFSIHLGGTSQEFENNASNKLGSVRDRTNTNYAWGQTNTEVNPGAGGIVSMYKVHLWMGYRNAAGNLYAEIDGVAYNGGTLMAIGTNNITEQAIGAPAHPMDSLQMGASAYIAGTQTPGDAAWVALRQSWIDWFQDASGLTLNSYPTAFPYVTLDSGGYNDTPTWTAATNRMGIPSSIQLHNGAVSYEVSWWTGGMVNGDQYEQRVHLVTKTGSDPALLYAERGVDWGVGFPDVVTLEYICFQVRGVTAGGVKTPFWIKSKFKLDNTL